MSDNEFIKEIEINNYDDLVKSIQGKSKKCDDLVINLYLEVLKIVSFS